MESLLRCSGGWVGSGWRARTSADHGAAADDDDDSEDEDDGDDDDDDERRTTRTTMTGATRLANVCPRAPSTRAEPILGPPRGPQRDQLKR